jgi:hypothetical protein
MGRNAVGLHGFELSDAGEKERKECVAGSLPPLNRKPAMTSSEAFQRWPSRAYC